MKTYLEYKDEKSQKFWEINISENSIVTRYGKINTDGKEIRKLFTSKAMAIYEMHKQILSKRKKDYAMPNEVSMTELLKYKVTNLHDIDIDHYSYLEGTYKTVIFIDGDITLHELDLDALHADGIIVSGNLKINGGVKNDCGDTGSFLIVEGDFLADYVVAGGSEVYLNGESEIHTFIIGFYNGGTLTVENTNTLCYINSDHCCDISGNITMKLDIFDKPNDVLTMINIFSKKEDFFECEDEDCYIDMDRFNKHIFDDKKRLNFLKKLTTI